MRVLIVDDEAPARERLRALLREIPDVSLVGEAENGHAALSGFSSTQPNLVLLDIRMPRMDGLETAAHLNKLETPPILIFTTAYEQHALNAFALQAMDYLLKPVSRAKLLQALERARIMQHGKLQLLRESLGWKKQRAHVSAPHLGGFRLAPVTEVRFFKAEQKYVQVCWPGEELLLSESLRSLEKEFGKLFLRVHRNALAAPRYIKKLERTAQGTFLAYFYGVPNQLAVSRRLFPKVSHLLRD